MKKNKLVSAIIAATCGLLGVAYGGISIVDWRLGAGLTFWLHLVCSLGWTANSILWMGIWKREK